jgi:hypothetical protein
MVNPAYHVKKGVSGKPVSFNRTASNHPVQVQKIPAAGQKWLAR